MSKATLGRLDRLGRLAGVAFVVLFLADIVITPGEPDPSAGASTVAGYYRDHVSAVQTVSLAHAIGGVFFLVFLGAVVSRARSFAGHTVAGLIGYAGVVAAATALLSYTAAGAAAALAEAGAGADPVATLAELRYTASSFADVGLVVMLAAYGVACAGSRAGRLLSIGTAVLLLAGVLGTFADDGPLGLAGFAGSILFGVWVVVVSLTGARSDQTADTIDLVDVAAR
jgi:hypothetical protein